MGLLWTFLPHNSQMWWDVECMGDSFLHPQSTLNLSTLLLDRHCAPFVFMTSRSRPLRLSQNSCIYADINHSSSDDVWCCRCVVWWDIGGFKPGSLARFECGGSKLKRKMTHVLWRGTMPVHTTPGIINWTKHNIFGVSRLETRFQTENGRANKETANGLRSLETHKTFGVL